MFCNCCLIEANSTTFMEPGLMSSLPIDPVNMLVSYQYHYLHIVQYCYLCCHNHNSEIPTAIAVITKTIITTTAMFLLYIQLPQECLCCDLFINCSCYSLKSLMETKTAQTKTIIQILKISLGLAKFNHSK